MIEHKEPILIAASMDDVGSGAILYGIKITFVATMNQRTFVLNDRF